MIAVDTNILLYAHRAEYTEHEEARETLTEVTSGPAPFGLPVFVIGEFLRVATHPAVYDPPTPRDTALSVIDAILDSPHARILSPTANYWSTLRSLVDDQRLVGNAVFDAQIAAVCIANGATVLLTNDRDFRRFDGLRLRLLPSAR